MSLGVMVFAHGSGTRLPEDAIKLSPYHLEGTKTTYAGLRRPVHERVVPVYILRGVAYFWTSDAVIPTYHFSPMVHCGHLFLTRMRMPASNGHPPSFQLFLLLKHHFTQHENLATLTSRWLNSMLWESIIAQRRENRLSPRRGNRKKGVALPQLGV